jgi:alkylation response protein AidB-like acyl-CoA dehydrogenase
MGATAIMTAGLEDQKQTLLPSLAAGEVIATLAFTEAHGRWEAEAVDMIATPEDGKYVLNGVKSFVLDGQSADLVVVVARRPDSQGGDGLSFFTVSGNAAGLERVLLKSADPTRKLAKLTFSNVEATLLGEEGNAAGPLRETLDIAAICLANEMVGGAERLFEDAVAYAKMRVQFGRPIASFQSLKHKAAEMLMEIELAKSGAYYAAAAADEGDEDVSALASLAKATAADTYMQTAIHAVQIHGGIGFTWENDTHLWFKRAKSSEVFLGGSDYHRERLMQEWGV